MQIPAQLICDIINDWQRRYGRTYPLYGKDTVRNDISGSIRPLLPSTELAHDKIIAERTGLPLRFIVKILDGKVETITYDEAELIVAACEATFEWYSGSLSDYY